MRRDRNIMIQSDIKTTIECESNSHVCSECGEKLIVNRWWTSLLFALIIFSPYLIGLIVSVFLPEELPENYCYYEDKRGEIIKKIFVDCSSYDMH